MSVAEIFKFFGIGRSTLYKYKKEAENKIKKEIK
jgi:ACT domain-containing protein